MELAILSGGHTGVERAALDVAWEFKLGRGGWCARGRVVEDGVLAAEYDLTETPSEGEAEAATWNVRDAGGTLVLAAGEALGTSQAVETCQHLGKPHLVVNLDDPKAADRCVHWIAAHGFEVVYVTGPREISRHGIYAQARNFLREVFGELTQPGGGELAEF